MTDRSRITAGRAQSRYSLSTISGHGKKRKAGGEQALFKYFLPDLKAGSTILEIGPGLGYFARACREKGYRYIGIEPSTKMREALSKEGFLIVDQVLPMLPLADASVDLIHSRDVVEHIEGFQSVMDYFREGLRVLRPGGFISTVAPNCETLGIHFWRYEYQHSYPTTRHRLERMLEDTGFQTVTSVAFLTNLGLTSMKMIDRVFAHSTLTIMRSPAACGLMEVVLGRGLAFRIHKNLCDHVGVLAQKPE